MKWFLYIVECSDKSFYTGITTDIEKRLKRHNNKTGAKSLRGKVPVILKYFEELEDRSKASKREREIKGWTRTKKFALIEEFTLNEIQGL